MTVVAQDAWNSELQALVSPELVRPSSAHFPLPASHAHPICTPLDDFSTHLLVLSFCCAGISLCNYNCSILGKFQVDFKRLTSRCHFYYIILMKILKKTCLRSLHEFQVFTAQDSSSTISD